MPAGNKIILDLKIAHVDEKRLWEYCTRLDLSINALIRKLILRELNNETILAEVASRVKKVKVEVEE